MPLHNGHYLTSHRITFFGIPDKYLFPTAKPDLDRCARLTIYLLLASTLNALVDASLTALFCVPLNILAISMNAYMIGRRQGYEDGKTIFKGLSDIYQKELARVRQQLADSQNR